MSKLIAIVMAAGHGTRMKSELPKVVHLACGRPLIYYPVRAALGVGADRVVVVANPQSRKVIFDRLNEHVPSDRFSLAIQETPRGTGDAVRSALASLDLAEDDRVLILSGDTPLLRDSDLGPLCASLTGEIALSFMYFRAPNPAGYGRVIRNSSSMPVEIIEHKDITDPSHYAINEVNAGVYLARGTSLKSAIAGLSNDNAQGEYYLTDVVRSIAGHAKTAAIEASAESLAGVNDRRQLSEVERLLFCRVAEFHGERGVSIVGSPLIDDTVTLAADVCIEDGVRLRGATLVGSGTLIDVGSVLTDAVVGEGVHIKPYCVVTESTVGNGSQLGPFAHLRPESCLGTGVHVGNFVETKNATLKDGAKANHLAYLGDVDVGERSNLGAGTIICNYDGFRKRRTVIGADAFIGSDSQLIAPVSVGDAAYVGTGTTVTEDVPPGALAIGRVRQTTKPGYADPLRARLKELAIREKSKSTT